MTDIVERLRGRLAFPADEALLRDAADEIECLRKMVPDFETHTVISNQKMEIERLHTRLDNREWFERNSSLFKEQRDEIERLREIIRLRDLAVEQENERQAVQSGEPRKMWRPWA